MTRQTKKIAQALHKTAAELDQNDLANLCAVVQLFPTQLSCRVMTLQSAVYSLKCLVLL